MREYIRQLDELTELYRSGAITLKEYEQGQALVAQRMADMAPKVEAATDQMTEFATQAARNMQSAFADFLFKPWEQDMGDMLRSFVDMLHRMAAEMLAQALLMRAFQSMAGMGGSIGSFGAAAAAALVRHDGGPVLAGSGSRPMPAYLWQFAPRYHGGGVAGLAPGEVPAILQTGEQVLSRAQVAAGMGQSAGGSVRIVNTIDPEIARDWVESAAGERTILTIIRRNPRFTAARFELTPELLRKLFDLAWDQAIMHRIENEFGPADLFARLGIKR